MLIVCPVAHNRITALSRANGILRITISALRQSRRKISTIRPVSAAPSRPSTIRPRMEFETKGDWSNSRRTSTSSGTAFLKTGMAAFTASITASVDASARLVTGM